QISQSGSQVSSPFGSQVGSQSGSQPSSYPGPRDPLAAGDVEPAGAARAPGAPPAPQSKVGWDKHPPAPAASGLPIHKLAVIGAVAATIAVIWLAAAALRSGSTEVASPTPPPAPVVAVAAVPPPPAPPPPSALPPDAAEPAAAEPAAAEPVAHESAPARRSRTAAASRASDAAPEPAPARPRVERAARTASGAQSPAEIAAGRGKLERPGAIAAGAEPPAAGGDAGDAEPHRAPTPPPAAPPPPSAAPAPAAPAVAAVAPPAAPVTATAAQIVAPAALEANRIAGNKLIAPDGLTQDAINRAGTDALVSTYKICVTADGAVSLVAQMKSSGFPVYDEKIRSTIRAEWRYRPYLVNGKPTPVCTALRFVYSH
ncbi:MAG TPA: hypothetical protein VK601_14355, partial [Kofleriaceae bacterium]|nr:hypothetical protein [Kofleriaceae bacterium]